MRPLARAGSFALIVSASAVLVTAQRATIPESIASGAAGRFTTVPSGPPPAIDDVLARTELVVRGVAGVPRSYLTDDQMDVLTDVPIIGPTVLFDAAAPDAGPTFPAGELVVTQLGGRIVVAGQPFHDHHAILPLLEPGADVLLLLQRVGGRLVPALSGFGAFALEPSGVRPLVGKTSFARPYRGVGPDYVIDDVLRRLARARFQRPNSRDQGRMGTWRPGAQSPGTGS